MALPARAVAGWEAGARVGFDSNVNRSVKNGESDWYLGPYLSFLKEASGETRLGWTFAAAAEGAFFAGNNDLSYASLSLAPGLTYFPYLSWTINISPFIRGKLVKDSDQSAVAFGAKVSLRQPIWKNIYAGEYYAYTDSRASLDAYSFTEHALGIFLGVNWTKSFSTEIGYEYSYGDSFRTLGDHAGSGRGEGEGGRGGGEGEGRGEEGEGAGEGRGRGRETGQGRGFSSAFGSDVFREKVDRHSIGVVAGIELTRSIYSQIGYTYTITDGDLGGSTDHAGFLSLAYRF
jgi:hypothetical protein